MPFRFRPSVRLGRGVRLHLGRTGSSVSVRRGRVSVNSRGTASVRLFCGLSYVFGRRR